MKITIESTNEVTTIDGAPARIWKGTTAGGVSCQVFVTRIAADGRDDCREFADLQETPKPVELVAALLATPATTPGANGGKRHA